jgi:hypothetical protein
MNVEDGGIYSDHCDSDGQTVQDLLSANQLSDSSTTQIHIKRSTDGSVKCRKGKQNKHEMSAIEPTLHCKQN